MGTQITDAVTSIMGVVSTVITTITSTPLLMIFLSASLVGIGVGIFKKLKG